MKKMMAALMTLVIALALFMTVSYAEEMNGFLGTWYLTGYQDLDNYPGTVFTVNGTTDWFTVYTDGTGLMLNDHVYTNASPDGHNYPCTLENGLLAGGLHRCVLEDGRLVDSVEYEGAVHAVRTYSREPNELRIAPSISESCQAVLTPEDFNGTYDIIQYGMNNAFIDAGEMDLQGTAVIENGKISMTWTRGGAEKHQEITFDAALNNGRLYTANEYVSHIISLRSDGTILLDAGLYQAQWLMRKQNAVSTETVFVRNAAFEKAFEDESGWYETEESRNRLASLLMQAAFDAGIDPESLRPDGHSYLGLVQDGRYPLLVAEGTGGWKNYLLHVGRGIDAKTQDPFVYVQWDYCIDTRAAYSDHEYLTEAFNEEFLSLFCGENLWQVALTAAE